MEKIDSFQELVDKLIDGRDLALENFNGSYDAEKNKSNYSKRANKLWEQLLYHIQNGVYNTNTPIEKSQHFGVRENDFPDLVKQSVLEFISKTIDLDYRIYAGEQPRNPINFFDLFIRTRGTDTHWNESVEKLIDFYYKVFFTNEMDNTSIAGTNLTYSDLKNADAGFSFNREPYVKPELNGDNKTYSEIRGNDKIKRVLEDMSNLQFTQTQSSTFEQDKINSYLRLIMPEYKREVQIEDLNRNFWAIGQALSALFSLLFDDDSVYPTMLSSLLDEIIQLWENIFYLWICVSIVSQKQKYHEDIKILFIPVSMETKIASNKIENTVIKDNITFNDFYDNSYGFDDAFIELYVSNQDETEQEKALRKQKIVEFNFNILKKVWERNVYLSQKYNNCSIVLIPEIRNQNYAHNYYSKVFYPGIIFYDNSLDNENDWLKIAPFEYTIIVDMTEQKIHFGEEKDNGRIYYLTQDNSILSVENNLYSLRR